MSSFSREATARTPAIELDAEKGSLTITGESYPEDVPAFYATLTQAIKSFFATHDNALFVAIKLTYFNSSSARALMELLDLLDEAASTGRAIEVEWYCDPDDDITREFAQDISSDISHISVLISDLEPHTD